MNIGSKNAHISNNHKLDHARIVVADVEHFKRFAWMSYYPPINESRKAKLIYELNMFHVSNKIGHFWF